LAFADLVAVRTEIESRQSIEAQLKQAIRQSMGEADREKLETGSSALNTCASMARRDSPICVGNSETCRRPSDVGTEELHCPCAFGQGSARRPYGRLNVLNGDEDEWARSFFAWPCTTRSAHWLQIFIISRQLRAICGPACRWNLSYAAGPTQSSRPPIYYVDLCARANRTIEAAITGAHHLD
jgi:hypothetical protein